jgi:nitroreductase
MNECANGCADLAVGRASGAEGFRRKCVAIEVTRLYLQFEKEAEAALGLPPGFHSYALLPIGYPMGRFGPVRRVPLADVVNEDRWGQPYRD